ncbi:MAG: VCBS repeat-containing protein [Calditrichaeota bacterium]|nr:VCBS repeat-containing protein [Calditrichota bacterium]HQU71599.1 FG-GAP-like repeat-containing protein [Calditrichia bacterium]
MPKSYPYLIVLGIWIGLLSAQEPNADPWIREMFLSERESLIPEFLDAYGVAFRDIDHSGLPDIYAVRFRDLNRLFLNQGAGVPMLDYTIASGLGGNLMSHLGPSLELGASAVDADNDGNTDILIVGWAYTTQLFHQESQLRFSSSADLIKPVHPADANAGVWADVDLDGDLDLFITDEHYPNRLYINNGAGHFEEKGAEWGVDELANSQGATFGDLDGDGYPDLYVCTWFEADRLYRNNRGRGFVRINLPLHHLQNPLRSNGVTMADFDNDGDQDLLVTDRDLETRLYRNDRSEFDDTWRFQDVNVMCALHNPYPAYGSIIADLNNDGFQDIFFTNIGPNRLFLGSDSGRFHLAYQQQIDRTSRIKHYSTGAAVADADGDGDLDLLVANKDTSSVLFINPLENEKSRFLRFALEGVRSNRDAIGARLYLYEGSSPDSGRLAASREISGGSGYLSLNEPIAHFGINGAGPWSARIVFPSGVTRDLENLSPNRLMAVAETRRGRRILARAIQWGIRQVENPAFWWNILLFLTLIALLMGSIWLFVRRYRWQTFPVVFYLVGALAVIYALMLLPGNWQTWQVLMAQSGVVLSAGVVIALIAEQLRRREKRNFGYRQQLLHFSRQLIFIRDNDRLASELTQALFSALDLQQAAAFFGEEDGVQTKKNVTGDWPEEPPVSLVLPEDRMKQLCHSGLLMGTRLQVLLPEFDHLPLLAVVPVVREDNLLGLLLLGNKRTGGEPGNEDLELLQILAAQAAIAIENNLYIKNSREMIQRLTEAELREQYVRELEEKNQTLQRLYRELQDTQAQLIQSEKMAGLGQLVAGVAHELNNPISFVYANMKELKTYIKAIDELLALISRENLTPEILKNELFALEGKYDLAFIRQDIEQLIEESREGSRRVKEVVQNLRNFSRLDESDYKAVDLHEGLESTLLLLNNELKKGIAVDKNYGKLPPVYCNPGQINQVFMNLLHNAVQAVETRQNSRIGITTVARGDRVRITIADNGPGIPEAVRNKIFDPFFTTKPVGSGTGLGLSISYNIIKRHRGKIALSSTPGEGTVFEIELPVNAGPPEEEPITRGVENE